MAGNVRIPFRSRLEPQESSFVVKVPHKFVHEVQRKFGIGSITLMPEYQNIQAFVYNLDSKEELEEVTSYPLQLVVTYGPNYYSKETPGKLWTYSQSHTRIDSVLLSINNHFDQHKPTGTFLPTLFFDWIHYDSLVAGETIRGYQEKTSQQAYGEVFNPAKHATWLPPSLVSRTDMNNCIFPTADNEAYLSGICLRMWIAPNTTVTFPNTHLPEALGFGANQIPAKSKRNQVPYVNADVQQYKCLWAQEPPLVQLPSDKIKGTKINCYTTKTTIKSPQALLQTKKKHEHDPALLFADYLPTIEKLARSINCFLSLRFDAAAQKFSIHFPNNADIYVRVFLSSKVMRQLGYDMSHGEYIDHRSVPSSVINLTLDTGDFEKKSRALVYDTGMVVISLNDRLSGAACNSQHDLTTMVTLEPEYGGVLRNRPSHRDPPQVYISSINPDMHFLLHRFNDNNEKTQLGWPVGAYVFGEIIGQEHHQQQSVQSIKGREPK